MAGLRDGDFFALNRQFNKARQLGFRFVNIYLHQSLLAKLIS
jgi:hypothetical protein